jgi:outer membrane biosynthesis protein TonB
VIATAFMVWKMKEYAFPVEPHFDDDRTVLAAQPVVPLAKINKKVRHRRQWFLGGAFAIAMMLGAASALIASYLKLRQTPTTMTEVSEDEDILPNALAAATPEPENINTVEEPTEEVAPKKEAPKHRTVVVKRAPEPEPQRDTHLSEDEQLQQIRQAVLVDEWQERRARRVERRERRRQERYNHRDLSNVDEIFEGRRRPN